MKLISSGSEIWSVEHEEAENLWPERSKKSSSTSSVNRTSGSGWYPNKVVQNFTDVSSESWWSGNSDVESVAEGECEMVTIQLSHGFCDALVWW